MIETDQERQLLAYYRQNPCRTLPNAFWKTARQLGSSSHLGLRIGQDGQLICLTLWVEDRLMAFWCEDPAKSPLSRQEVAALPFALVHNTTVSIFHEVPFSQREAYFRLICTHPPQVVLPPGFRFGRVNPSVEMPAVAQMIKNCYQDIHVSAEIVGSWMDHPVYDPRLWVWVLESATGKKVALGIAELDTKVPEASLEWIQVLPSYQGRGIGTALVSELCRRVWREVDFITVSGKVNSKAQPERLYRRCGFTGSDVWWLLVA